MKNKVLAFSAAILLASTLAFGFSKSSKVACSSADAATCCPANEQCPPQCCVPEGATCCE